MIYLDSSVALAHILEETRRPPDGFRRLGATSSRLLAYEVSNRLNICQVGPERRQIAREVLRFMRYVELTQDALARALRPFPVPVSTLDGLHLATMDHLRDRGLPVTLATYDARLLAAAEAMGFETVEP